MNGLPRQNFAEVLVGYDHSDDAGVYLLNEDLALVQTVDFFPPIVDDPFTYGQIAAANALSDIYAMGGQPKTALSLVAFPAKGLEFSVLGEIMKGGLDKLSEAGVALLGGHSLRDDEIKFGYAVTGIIQPKDIKQNKGARVGDRLVLTKPLGTGLIATAIKKGRANPQDVLSAVIVMTQLNRVAAEICVRHEVSTMTDITGFGLAGHSLEVATASGVSIEIDHLKIPVIRGAMEYSREGLCAGGLISNREFFSDRVRVDESVPKEFVDLVYDPQTSGGLLAFASPHSVQALLVALGNSGVDASIIGQTIPSTKSLLGIL